MAPTLKLGLLTTLAFATSTAFAGCPFLSGQEDQQQAVNNNNVGGDRLLQTASSDQSSGKDSGPDFSQATYEAIQADLEAMFTDSQDFWPADFGNYGPLFVRLAWHCAGSYRASDGRGGCDGARLRFPPERSWDDNTNLDKSLLILTPTKLKYGDAITWADLIILAGDQAIRFMGGPILGFCAGRLDDDDGEASLELGPTPEQEAVAPCPEEGACESPLGTSTVGLIYVNPQGPMGVPDPAASALQVRDVFKRMGMNDTETVALIGGGHAFGKVHGACPTGAGPNPQESPEDPWPGTCGDPDSDNFGRAENTFTSGFEGAWTEEPTVWNNQYFLDLLEYDWVQSESPAGATQWVPVPMEGATDTDVPNIIMLTADIALLFDDTYLAIVKEYAASQEALDIAFSSAWYKLVTRDVGPVTRCAGTDVPPPQEFQLPLPEPPTEDLGSLEDARNQIKRILSNDASNAAKFVTLAFRCSATFRATDNLGGCNGARIRFPPQIDWDVNAGLNAVLDVLMPLNNELPGVAVADLIVLAGTVALEEGESSIPTLSFCPGRADADQNDPNNELLSILEPMSDGITEPTEIVIDVLNRMRIAGLTVPQFVALAARPRSPELMTSLGYSGSYNQGEAGVSNALFTTLLTNMWEVVPGSDGQEYKAVNNPGVFALATDLALIWDPVLKAQSVMYAEDNEQFLYEFGLAWTALMNADRFDGPTGSECD